MTEQEHAEISRQLALAIGYQPSDVEYVVSGCAVKHATGPHNSGKHWYSFDYRNPDVIWPIAERFDCFPIRGFHYWHVHNGIDTVEKTAALAVARAVIAAKGKE